MKRLHRQKRRKANQLKKNQNMRILPSPSMKILHPLPNQRRRTLHHHHLQQHRSPRLRQRRKRKQIPSKMRKVMISKKTKNPIRLTQREKTLKMPNPTLPPRQHLQQLQRE
jgi:hypothetical protein